ncbi:epoxide hydrolase family protein [Cellulosimicrobium marinum]|uniref:epoxide hydrolase family protein n=1 Tax=Cellulosimicrobium marinum TaxID=1638992 RepID=UPI001E4B6A0B|nr:epoxide hydrolase [Cellulosimicrobium marinum]MCB7135819.1 epoxide hydrolase 1 [Cellulosimicrobium marinum]
MTTNPLLTPFRIEVPQTAIDDLRARLARARFADQLPAAPWGAPEAEGAADWSHGVPDAWLRETVAYWRDAFDWRAFEDRVNAVPQFLTEVDGQRIHVLHARSSHEDATPLVLTHGWPGSFVEFLDLVGPLTEPQDHGGDPADAFHIVVPSIPGFGFSSPLADAGWDDTRVARAFAEVMTRLGYDRFVAQGGDAGAGISPEIARVAPDRVIGVHVNGTTGPMPELPLAPDVEAALTDRERRAVADIEAFSWSQMGYISIQATRPGLVGSMLADSPVAQLAWIMDKFQAWTWPVDAPVFDVLDRDVLLANVSLYWFTATAGSAAMTVYAQSGGWGTPKERSETPLAVLNLAHDIAIRRFVEQENTVVRWTDADRGGHFAALEEPGLLVADLRAFVRELRLHA